MKNGAMAKDLNISENRVINVAEGAENDHVATKKYVDYLHALSPDSNVQEYVRFINSRRDTRYSLTTLCGIKWTIDWTDKERVKETTGPFNLFESQCCHMSAELRTHLSRYIVDSQKERKGVGNPGEPAKKEGGLDDGLLFDIIFANNQVANKSPVKTATNEPIQAAKSPQIKAKETKKASTKT